MVGKCVIFNLDSSFSKYHPLIFINGEFKKVQPLIYENGKWHKCGVNFEFLDKNRSEFFTKDGKKFMVRG